MVWTSANGSKCPVSPADRGEFMKPSMTPAQDATALADRLSASIGPYHINEFERRQIVAALRSTPSASAGPQAEVVIDAAARIIHSGAFDREDGSEHQRHEARKKAERVLTLAHPQPQQTDGRGDQLRAAVIEEALTDLTGAMKFVLAFYEPGQRYLDTNAWKQAEALAGAAYKKAEAALSNCGKSRAALQQSPADPPNE